MEKLLKQLGVLNFIAVKNQYNNCIGKNGFYNMISRRLKHEKAENLADSLIYELKVHFKEFAQYQN